MLFVYLFFFFFSSRRRHTRWPRDWSSDVCSSDLVLERERLRLAGRPDAVEGNRALDVGVHARGLGVMPGRGPGEAGDRSEERRVGKSVDLGGGRMSKKKKDRNRVYEKTCETRVVS